MLQDYERGNKIIAIVGLGYVGMPMAVAFSKYFRVIGFDINQQKVEDYKKGIDHTDEVGSEELLNSNLFLTANEEDLAKASFYIVAVPTPINQDKTPDLNPVESVSCLLGKYLLKGDVVVYESTVYPGVTEDICVPLLAEQSGLTYITDFKVGYSPERINPSDKVHRFENIVKIISACDEETLELMKGIYGKVITAGVYPVSAIKVAEAAKVVENSQRDINIAFMNELAIVFHKMGIDTNEVIDAMNTKWNALGFRPGLVGGHCIGVDPYYFVYEAERLGYHSQIVLSGRQVNDSMAAFVSDAIIKCLIRANILIKNAKVAIMGITFKENCPDIRNSKVVDIINCLREYEVDPIIFDPLAEKEDAKRMYGLELANEDRLSDVDCVVVTVAHDCFIRNRDRYLPQKSKVVLDVKGIWRDLGKSDGGYLYWSL